MHEHHNLLCLTRSELRIELIIRFEEVLLPYAYHLHLKSTHSQSVLPRLERIINYLACRYADYVLNCR